MIKVHNLFADQIPKSFSDPNELAAELFARIDKFSVMHPRSLVLPDLRNRLHRLLRKIWLSIFLFLSSAAIFRFIGLLGLGKPARTLAITYFAAFIAGVIGCILFVKAMASLSDTRSEYLTFTGIDDAKLMLTRHPVRLGGAMVMVFKRHLKRGLKTENAGAVLGRMLCLEICREGKGTDPDKFYGELIWQYDLPREAVVSGLSCIEQEWTINIPVNAPPTMRDKKLFSQTYLVLWLVEIKLVVPGLVNETSLFSFDVEPEVVCTNI